MYIVIQTHVLCVCMGRMAGRQNNTIVPGTHVHTDILWVMEPYSHCLWFFILSVSVCLLLSLSLSVCLSLCLSVSLSLSLFLSHTLSLLSLPPFYPTLSSSIYNLSLSFILSISPSDYHSSLTSRLSFIPPPLLILLSTNLHHMQLTGNSLSPPLTAHYHRFKSWLLGSKVFICNT